MANVAQVLKSGDAGRWMASADEMINVAEILMMDDGWGWIKLHSY